MRDLSGRLAVVTGGGSGMGRELVRQLVAEGCSIATCDVSASGLAETKRLCEQESLPQGLRITTHIVDVAKVVPMPKAAGKWNTYDITATGDHFVVLFNGQKTVDVTDKRLTEAGPIALQYGSGVLKWRKVQIRAL